MRNVKNILTSIAIGLLLITMNSCKKCKGEDPSARIVNNGTAKASVQIKTSGGSTTNVNNIAVGTSSEYASYASGSVQFTVTVASEELVKSVDMTECFNYEIKIDGNNVITTESVDRNE